MSDNNNIAAVRLERDELRAERDALAAALRACEEYAHYADRGPASERDVLVAIESMARAALDNLNK